MGSFVVYFLLWFFSLLAFIRSDSRIMQKVYYRVVAWMIPISWVMAFWSLLAAIIGGSMKKR